MAQVKLELRPPPNVDFVHGYPGIPPGAPDRPQAAVKGAIEVRVPSQGVKAKWVRIELRKVETLPGGGQANTFYDFVGPSPVNLWNSPDEYALLRSQDFPFSIRIPESIPPSIALENRAGINYELVASVCTKGKKGFLRKAKSVVVSSQATIIIDKHELHSTWPVYCQPETRHLAQEGVNLIVQRNHTCYGPGDRISVNATVKSDSLHTVILRGFEMSLKESTVFRAGPYAQGRKSAPQVKVVNVCDSKLVVNSTLYGGTQHQAELSCLLSQNHTTTTLNAARHIDITYTLSIKALMGTGTHLVMDLPVIVSNWQSHVSAEAIRRIGPAPSLSLLPVSNTPTTQQPPRGIAPPGPAVAGAPPSGRPDPSYGHARSGSNTAASPYSTVPTAASSTAKLPADEMGYGAGYGIRPPYNTHQPPKSSTLKDEFPPVRPTPTINTNLKPITPPPAAAPAATPAAATNGMTTGVGRRPRSAGGGGGGNRFTIMNAHPTEISEDHTGGNTERNWLTAEEEKAQLFEKARARVERTQGPNAAPPPASQTPASRTASPPRAAIPAAAPAVTPANAWLSAEDEKLLYQKATNAVQMTQGIQPAQPPFLHSEPTKNLSGGSNTKTPSAAAAMYAQAISARNIKADSLQKQGARSVTPPPAQVPAAAAKVPVAAQGSTPARGPSFAAQGSAPTRGPSATAQGSAPARVPAVASTAQTTAGRLTSPGPAVPQYLTAEQEKAALRRYEEARRAVDRIQGNVYGSDDGHGAGPTGRTPGPIAYDSLYSSAAAGSSSHNGPAADEPPPFDSVAPPSGPQAILSEKERMRRAYEMQDAAAHRNNANTEPPPNPYSPAVPSTSSGQYAHALAQKEALRRKFEARDALSRQNSANPQPPPRSNSINGNFGSPGRSPSVSSTGGPRPAPVPPTTGGSGRVLTAIEEKAMLKAKFDAMEAPQPLRMNGRASSPLNGRQGSASVSPPSSGVPSNAGGSPIPPAQTPPPLMPRPPVEYIQETQEEDARVSRFTMNGENPSLDEDHELVNHSPKLVNGVGNRAGLSSSSAVTNGSANAQQFTPFLAGFEGSSVGLKAPGPPPPLPPKPAE